jgi:hypothetical protein
MSHPGPNLDDLVRAHREGVRLTPEQRARNRARILSRVAAVGAAASATAAGTAGSAAGSGTVGHLTGWLGKLVVGLALASSAGAAWYVKHPSRSIESIATTLPADLPRTDGRNETRGGDAPAVTVETTSASDAPAAPVAAADSNPASSQHAARRSSSTAASLAAEIELLHDVQAALEAGQPERALQLLDARRGRAAGPMQEERAAARVVTLCKLGRVDEARGEAARFARDWPRSPLAERVRSSCANTPANGPK